MVTERNTMSDATETAFVELENQHVEAVSGGARYIVYPIIAYQVLRAAWNAYKAR